MTSPVSACGPPIAAPVDVPPAPALALVFVEVNVDVVTDEPNDTGGRLVVTDGGGKVDVEVNVGDGGRVIPLCNSRVQS